MLKGENENNSIVNLKFQCETIKWRLAFKQIETHSCLHLCVFHTNVAIESKYIFTEKKNNVEQFLTDMSKIIYELI